MNDNQLSDVLNAFISRFSLNDIFQIDRAVNNSCHVHLNNGNRGQIEAQKAEREVINAVIKRMLPHDKQLISEVISKVSSGK